MSDGDDDDRHNANIAVLVAIAIVVILGVVLMHFISANLSMERCLEERRHDCDSGANP